MIPANALQYSRHVRITVVVPTFRRPDALAACLDALAQQTLARAEYEVVVVDNATPPTASGTVRAFEARLDLRGVHEPARGPAAARNSGARVARAPHIAFTDDDCRPEPGWLAALAEAIERDPTALIGGETLDGRPENLCSAASHLLVSHFTARQNVDLTAPAFFPSNNLAAPARELAALGGFDARFPRAAGEDRDLCERWRAHGRRLVHAPQAVVRHAPSLTLWGFLRQQMAYGRGACALHGADAPRPRPGRRFQGPAFYAGLLAQPYRIARLPRATALTGLVLLSQAAVAAGYLAEGAGLKGFRSGG
jgi:GT2 family glycosyltransferase